MDQLRIGFIPLVRVQFDVPLAKQMIAAARANLEAAGFCLLGPAQPVSDAGAARAAVQQLAADALDLVLVFQATFADSTMVKEIAAGLSAPLFLWAVPEPWSGGRLRLNSLCGINLAGHALTLQQRQFEYAYAPPDAPEVAAQVRTLASAGRLRRRMRAARVGVVGEHPNGMDSCHLDEPALKRAFGVSIERIPLDLVFERARAVSTVELEAVRSHLAGVLDNLDDLQQPALQGTLSVFIALKQLAEEAGLDGLAVRCWPEFFTTMGCAACGAMSMLSEGFRCAAPIPCSCEADINGTITQLMLHWLAEQPSFGTDMVAADLEGDALAVWHCGLAPFSMAAPGGAMKGGNHSNRGVPLVMDYKLKPGPLTIARLSQATGELRLVLGRGEMLDWPKPFSGTAGVLRLERPVRHFLDLLMHEGLEHHVSLVYGDYQAELQKFAALIGLPVLMI